jgi:hypothetical protein
VVPAPPVINAIGVLANAVVGMPYTYAFTAQGTPPITWSISAGTLPSGLTLSPAGVLSGTPTTVGAATFTVRAANQSTQTATAVVSLNVVASPPVINAIGVLANAVVGVPYSRTFTAQGTPPITWNISAGTLPAGLTLSSAGVLGGTPTTAGTANFTVRASNAGGASTEVVNLQVVPPVVVPPMPTSKDECKKDGWRTFGVFRNQGDCVSYVENHKPPKGPKSTDECKKDGWRRYGVFRHEDDCCRCVETRCEHSDRDGGRDGDRDRDRDGDRDGDRDRDRNRDRGR